MRFFKELRTPSLKCARVGHKDKTTRQKIMKRGWHEVASTYKADITQCTRCRRREGPTNEEFISSYSSVTLPSSDWDILRKDGYLIL